MDVGVVGGCKVGVESSLYRTRNLVMFFWSSSMFRARMSNPSVSAARALPIAAELAGVDGKRRCCAAAEVEDVSIRSAWGRCVFKYVVHCVQTWGWVCRVLMVLMRVVWGGEDEGVGGLGVGAASRQWWTAR